jgi:hypothetical protein
MTDWAVISSLTAAASTLVLAGVTYASVRSANRSARTADRAARVAEQSLLAGQRPLLMGSRLQDPEQKILFQDGSRLRVAGGRAALKATDDVVYLAVSIRNVGTGLAVIHGWHLCTGVRRERVRPELDEFTTQNMDIYVAPGDNGFWEGAYRDPNVGEFKEVGAAIDAGDPLSLSLLYGDFEGGQRVISQFTLRRGGPGDGRDDGRADGPADGRDDGRADERADRWLASAVRHFNVDRPDPR